MAWDVVETYASFCESDRLAIVLEAAEAGLPEAMVTYANLDPDWPSEASLTWIAEALSSRSLRGELLNEARDMHAILLWYLRGDGREICLRGIGDSPTAETITWYGDHLISCGDDRGWGILKDRASKGDIQAYLLLGNRLQDRGRLEEAVEVLKEGLNASQNAYFATNVGLIICDQEGEDAAIPWMRRAANLGDQLAVRWLRSTTRRTKKERRSATHGQ